MTEHEKEIYDSGYHTGWRANDEYRKEYRAIATTPRWGVVLMFAPAMLGSILALIGVMSYYNEQHLDWARWCYSVSFCICVGLIGYLVNRRESASIKAKWAAFDSRWAPVIPQASNIRLFNNDEN